MEDVDVKIPWFRQPLVWMLLVIPGSAVVAGFITLYLAIESFDGMVVDDYYKHGKEINRVLKRDRRAGELGLSADLQIDPGKNQTVLLLGHKGEFKAPDRLKLRFLHTTRAGYDEELALIHQGKGRYAGAMPQLRPGSWHVLLEADDWRISGQLGNAGQRSLQLAPAVP